MALRHHLRDAGARIFWGLGLSRPRRTARGQLTIVTFHRVLPEPDASPLPQLAVTPKLLRGCLAFFAEHYTCLTVSRAVDRFFTGERPARPLLAVTFDDGRKDGFLYGLPHLRATGVPATFYVPAGYVDNTNLLWHDELAWVVRRLEELGASDAVRKWMPGLDSGALVRPVLQHAKSLSESDRNAMIAALRERAGELNLPPWEGPMSWSELRQLTREGHEVGSHSMSHSVLREDLCADQHREVAESRRVLEKNVKAPITSFCFPTGEYDATTLHEVRAAGYQSAVTTHPGLNDVDIDPFELRRIDIQGRLNANRCGEVQVPVLAWRLSRLPGAPG